MASKYKLITQLYEEALYDIAKSPDKWALFLNSATWNFGYNFSDKLCIYAQRPDATACTTLEDWNKKAKRWINSNAKSIALIKENNGIPVLKYVFDVSDTHQYHNKEYKLWEVKKEHENEIIDALENKFGTLSIKENLAEAIYSAATIAVEDNMPDYLSELEKYTTNSFLEELDELNIETRFRTLLTNSVTYMMLVRCNINPFEYFTQDDFRNIVDFNSYDTIIRLGNAVSDIAEMGISEIKRTVQFLEKQEKNKNRTFDKVNQKMYSDNIKERGDNYGDNIHESRRVSNSRFEIGEEKQRSNTWKIRQNEIAIPKREQQIIVSGTTNERPINGTFNRDTGKSNSESGTDNWRIGETREFNRRDEKQPTNEVGTINEQLQKFSRGNSNDGIDLQLEQSERKSWKYIKDENPKEFYDDDTINSILKNSPNIINKIDEIKTFLYTNRDNKDKCTEYISNLFSNAYTEYTIGSTDNRVGHKTYKNGLYLWKGDYLHRTEYSFRPWSTIAEHFMGMTLLREFEDIKFDAPNVEQQLEIISQAEVENTSVFSFPQEIIDKALQSGSGFEEGKYRIYHQLQTSFSSKDNVEFLKREYGDGGYTSVLAGTGINVWYSAKGIKLYRKNDEELLLNWSKVEKRLKELINDDRYFNTKEQEYYPLWLEKQEQVQSLNETKNILTEEQNSKPLPNSLNEFFLKNDIFDTSEVEKTEEQIKEIEEGLKNPKYISDTIDYLNEVKKAEDDNQELNKEIDYYIDKLKEIYKTLEQKGYEFRIGDIVYIGTDEYEISSIGDINVSLYDPRYPLFGREMSREEFNKKIEENPANDHLLKINRKDNITEIQTEKEEQKENINQTEDIISEKDKSETKIIPKFEHKKIKLNDCNLHPEIKLEDRNQFKILNDNLGVGTPKEKYKRNVDAIKVLKKCEKENRYATPEEQQILANYVGWGGLQEAFDDKNNSWSNEYLELVNLLSEDEYEAARASTLTAFYTPPVVIRNIYKVLENMGVKRGNILEPSCGIGNFIGMIPNSLQECKLYGVELDSITGRIAQQLYQKTTISINPYENTNLQNSFFDVAIGNVPFRRF